MLDNDASNSAHCGLLDEIERQTDPGDTVLVTWIALKRTLLMATLKPLGVDDANPLIDLSSKQGGIATFKEV